jgi:hypothetical protein
MKSPRFIFLLALGASVLWLAQPVVAQSYLLPSAPEKGVWIEAAHPNLKGFFEVTLPSTIWFASARVPVTPQVGVVVELPFAYARMDSTPFGGSAESNTVLGNPYVGAEYAFSRQLSVQLGLRAPVTTAGPESWADVIAVLANLQRMEAFLENVLPVSIAASFQQAVADGFSVRSRAGVTQAFYIGDDDGEAATLLDYGVFGTYSVSVARFGAGLSGRWDISGDEGFSDNSFHLLGFTADAGFGRFRPGLSVHIPLDEDYRQFLGSTIGAYVQIALP